MKTLSSDSLNGLFVQANSVCIFSSGDVDRYSSFESTASELLKNGKLTKAEIRKLYAENGGNGKVFVTSSPMQTAKLIQRI